MDGFNCPRIEWHRAFLGFAGGLAWQSKVLEQTFYG